MGKGKKAIKLKAKRKSPFGTTGENDYGMVPMDDYASPNAEKREIFLDKGYVGTFDDGDVVKVGTEDYFSSATVRIDDVGNKKDGVLSDALYKSLDIGSGDSIDVYKIDSKDARTLTLKISDDQGRDPNEIEAYARKALMETLDGSPVMRTEKIKGIQVEFEVPDPMSNKKRYEYDFDVISYRPKNDAVVVTEDTKVRIKKGGMREATYEMIGGLEKQKKALKEMVELPLVAPDAFKKMGTEPPKGVIMHGPPGCGKTLLARAIATETDAYFMGISGPELLKAGTGESAKLMRGVFEEAKKNSPSVVFIDEIDSIAPDRDEGTGGGEYVALVSQLLTIMDGMDAKGDVIVMAATNRVDSIDKALRRPGRFDREIEIPVPDKDARTEILKIHSKNMPLDKTYDLEKLSEITNGYTGADLEHLCREAALNVIGEHMDSIIDSDGDTSYLDGKTIAMDDFMTAYKKIIPSGLREVSIETPNVTMDMVGGLHNVKKELSQAIEWKLKYPDLIKKSGVKPPKGILMYGPPGCGKTLLAKAAANKSEANFISIKGPELLSKWVGDSEKGVRDIFRKAREYSPCVLFFDEIDGLTPKRDSGMTDAGVGNRVVSQFLTEIDGVEGLEDVVILAATNRKDMVDDALLRPGRFDKLVNIGWPDQESREEIYKIHTKKKPLADDVDLSEYADIEGLSGADIEWVCNEAATIATRDFIENTKDANSHADDFVIDKQYFDNALNDVFDRKGKKKKIKIKGKDYEVGGEENE